MSAHESGHEESDYASAESEQEELEQDQVQKEISNPQTDPVSSSDKEPTQQTENPSDSIHNETPEAPVEDKPEENDSSKDTTDKKSSEDTKASSGGGWGWGGWGSSLWSSVSTVTESAQSLGSKVSSVIASVEEGLGLPSPDELAAKQDDQVEGVEAGVKEKAEPVVEEPHSKPLNQEPSEEKADQEPSEEKTSDASYGGFLTGIASVVQSTGKGLVSGGLDALETLGKKTMEVLSEGDPGLQKKRALLSGGGSPTLSQLLEQAKNRPEAGAEAASAKSETPLNYSRLFDEYHGVVHLEALELLSRECASKAMSESPSLAGDDAERVKEVIEELEACFVVEEDQDALDDDSSKLPEALALFSDSKLPIKVDKLLKVSNSWREKAEQMPTSQSSEADNESATSNTEPEQTKTDTNQLTTVCENIYSNGLRSLAELTSATIELFKKTAELTLLPNVDKDTPISQAKKLNRLTVLVCSELDCLASVHSEAITQLDVPGTNSSVTSLYLEASNSSTYVQDAYQLLLPILKVIQIQQLSAEAPQPEALSRT